MRATSDRVEPGTAPEPPRGGPRGLWYRFVTSVRHDADTASLEAIGTADRRASDRTVATVLVVGALCLTGIEYLGRTFEPDWFRSTLELIGLDGASAQVQESIFESDRGKFWGLLFWATVRMVFYVVVPLFVARSVLGLRPGDLGLRLRGSLRHGGPYALLFVAVLPAIVAASYGPEFEQRYPFYDPLPGEGLWPYLLGWWVIYAIQFVGVEVFFRGFLVLGLAPRFGATAVYVSVVPYVMIHFDKPMLETLGAVLAGTVLGFLSLKYRSIWWGAALHIAVAVTFDVLALWHQEFWS